MEQSVNFSIEKLAHLTIMRSMKSNKVMLESIVAYKSTL